MVASKRPSIPTVKSIVYIFILIILAGCNPRTQDLVEVNPTLDSLPTMVSIETVVEQAGIFEEILFDFEHQSNGLLLDSGGDVDTEVVEVGSPPEMAFRSGNGWVLPSADENTEPDWYMQFQVDDAFIFKGEPTVRVQIEIEYLDEGIDSFNIQYDALSGGPYGDGIFKETENIVKTDSGEFKSAVFKLNDAYFANRDNGADFRISDLSDGAETVRRVTITLLSPETEVVQSPTGTPLPHPELLPDGQASVIFYNGVILTMEGESLASAIALKVDRVLDVGSDEDMLAYAGQGTELIDLEGRTLMPGFVDAHSHVFFAWANDLDGGQDYLLSNGITTIAEMGSSEKVMQEIQSMDRERRLRVRVSIYPLHVTNCGELLGPWYADKYPVSREPGAMLQIPGVKIFNDGGSCNAPAVSYNREGVIDGPGSGDLYFTVPELTEIITDVQENGYQAAIHGLGDRAIETIQDSIEAALAGGPNIYRHRIEHNGLVRDDMLDRYDEVGIVPIIFGAFPTCYFTKQNQQFGEYSTPGEFQHWEWRWRDLIDANPNSHFAWHADEPPLGPANPMRHLHSFVTRIQVQEDGTICEPPVWAADDLLTVEEALPIMTIESAYALFREEEIGSLKAGKLGDLIVLSENPLEVDQDAILNIQVLMTMVGGQVEYCAPGQETLCP